MEFHSTIRPCTGQVVSGDAVFAKLSDTGLLVAIIDILGHGPEAEELATKVLDFLESHCTRDLLHSMRLLHDFMTNTRGGAVGLCYCDIPKETISYVGIGNTVIKKFGETKTNLPSLDGTVGLYMRTPKQFSMPICKGDLVILHTDGVSSQFTREQYAAIDKDRPMVVSREIIQRFGKDFDDAACAAFRYMP